jgi:RimJ/RimL family protein N-acetyltransferase
MVSYILSANTASIRVATKLGEVLRGTTALREREVLVYAITRAEWEARRGAT